MPTRMGSEPLFDLFSFARRGPGQRDRLSPAEIQQIARAVGRTPEVMVKVLPRGTNNMAAVRRHLAYIGRQGALDLETDDGEILRGKRVGDDLLADWDLELDEYRGRADLTGTRGKPAPKLVHKVMFSMPAGTSPDKVLGAVQNFCREEFALKHRYVLALHTDEPHPHVHVVIKAVSEDGHRLHIRKDTLRAWRAEFARHLRTLGVPANATPRYVRGQTRPQKPDGIYRASLRGASTHIRERAMALGRELVNGGLRVEPGKTTLIATRNQLRQAWLAVSDTLVRDGHMDLAGRVKRYTEQLPPARTEKEFLAANLLERSKALRVQERAPTR